jgi:hypothetical protein
VESTKKFTRKQGALFGRRKRPKTYSLEQLGRDYHIDFNKAGKPEDHLPSSPHLEEEEKKKE